MSARAQILTAARRALANQGELPAIPRAYRGAGTAAGDDLASTPARFEERVREYGARVSHATPATVATTLDRIAAEHGAARLVRPYGLELHLPGTTLVADGRLSPAELDAVDGVVTGCAAAIADTGTIILDGGAICGRRAISLIPTSTSAWSRPLKSSPMCQTRSR